MSMVLPYRLLASATALLLVVGSAVHGQLHAADPADWVAAHVDEVVALYRDLHQHPELSFQEEQTAARLAKELQAVGADVATDVGGHGVVGILTNGEGLSLMLRADMDALPVVEQTGLVYSSQVRVPGEAAGEVGVMHACGHDVHMSNLIGVARYLADHKSDWRGTVMFVCQPAEERGAGARAMLDDGLFERFSKPDFALALHVDSSMPTGQLGYRAGYALANVDSVDITMIGRGGHGAYPHATIDPIVQAAQLVLQLQTIVSREVSPTDPAVITVGSIHGGAKHNVIGDECHLQITVRSYKDEVREHLLDAIARKAKAVAIGARAEEPKIEISEGTPAMFNDEELVARVLPSLRRAVGEENVVPVEPVMGGEDFSHYGRAGVPAFMFRLGSVDEERLAGYERIGQQPPSLHSAVYYPDIEDTLRTGITALTTAALDLLGSSEQ